MSNSITSASPAAAPAPAPTGSASTPESEAIAIAWLLFSLGKDLDADGDGHLTFAELSQNRTSSNISAENQATLREIDQDDFVAMAHAIGGDIGWETGGIVLNRLAFYGHLHNLLQRDSDLLPSDCLVLSMTLMGQIADPSVLTPGEQEKLADMEKRLCTGGFAALTPVEKEVVTLAAFVLVGHSKDLADGYKMPGFAMPIEQLNNGIITLVRELKAQQQAELQAFGGAVGALNNPSAWGLMERFQLKGGQRSDSNNEVVWTLSDGSELRVDRNRLKNDAAKDTFDRLLNGQSVTREELAYLESDDGSENLFDGDDWDTWMRFTQPGGPGILAQLTPESPEWDQLPTDQAVPDPATRQAMINAAKLILSPEQTANREALMALGADAKGYNREDWQGWLDAQLASLKNLEL